MRFLHTHFITTSTDLYTIASAPGTQNVSLLRQQTFPHNFPWFNFPSVLLFLNRSTLQGMPSL